jgi:hypothetical protein
VHLSLQKEICRFLQKVCTSLQKVTPFCRNIRFLQKVCTSPQHIFANEWVVRVCGVATLVLTIFAEKRAWSKLTTITRYDIKRPLRCISL